MIGVVGEDDETIAHLEAALAEEGLTIHEGSAEDVVSSDPSMVVTIGEPALLSVAGSGDVPILPIDTEPGVNSIPRERAAEVITAVMDGSYRTTRYPRLDVRVAGEASGEALFEAMLATEEPAQISEYRIEADGSAAKFRADGVVVATAAGSHGYAHAAGGPLVAQAIDVAVVVPVAAFAMQAECRVADPARNLALSVERDEAPVDLMIDGQYRRSVPPGASVEIHPGEAVETIRPKRARLEKL